MFQQKLLIIQKLLLIQNNSNTIAFIKHFFFIFFLVMAIFLVFAKNENQFQIYSGFPSVFSSSSNDA